MPLTSMVHDASSTPPELGACAGLLDLLHLCSAGLPVGTYAYSQGLEWAVEARWVVDEATLSNWLAGQLQLQVACVDLPLLKCMLNALDAGQPAQALGYSQELLAWRETAELRAEERARGLALMKLLPVLGIIGADASTAEASISFAYGFALASNHWGISPTAALTGYAYSWLEAEVLAGVKLVPLGQLAGQRVLYALRRLLPDLVAHASRLPRSEIGGGLPGLSIASAAHESQYTRLFRS